MADFEVAADALRRIGDRARDAGGRAAADAMANTFRRGVVEVELNASTHPRGTPTPAPPGSPPSRVSGDLLRSMKITPAVPTGPTTWTAKVYPTIIYARIQELGGLAGRHHRSKLPPRPYMRPARARMEADGSLHDAASGAFGRAVHDG